MNPSNRNRIKIVARALGELRGEVIFVGGSVVDLYVTNPDASDPRSTVDVDCIVEILNRSAYYQLEDDLRRRGFVSDISDGAPLCRWIVGGERVDVMPVDPEILGFGNEWYRIGIPHSIPVNVDDDVTIRILKTPYFLATKVAAMKSRGMSDLRLSGDFDDIVYVLRNRKTVAEEIGGAEKAVRAYLSRSVAELLSYPGIDEALSAVLTVNEPLGTEEKVFSVLREIASLTRG